jgi:hypothetical protein
MPLAARKEWPIQGRPERISLRHDAKFWGTPDTQKISAELLTEAKGSLALVADMHKAPSGHTPTMLKSGAVLVIVGADTNGIGLKTAE